MNRARERGFGRARAAGRFGLFSFALTVAACGPKSPAEVARAADVANHTGAYSWLAEHDPSALIVVGLDADTIRAVAPDAHVRLSPNVSTGCRAALLGHALLATIAPLHSNDRDRAEDCGFAIFHDDRALVVAPRP